MFTFTKHTKIRTLFLTLCLVSFFGVCSAQNYWLLQYSAPNFLLKPINSAWKVIFPGITDSIRLYDTGKGLQLQFYRSQKIYTHLDSLLTYVGGSGIQYFPHSQSPNCPYPINPTSNAATEATNMTDYVDPAYVWTSGTMIAPPYGTNSQATDTIVIQMSANVTRLISANSVSNVNLWVDFFVTHKGYGVKQWIPVAYITGTGSGVFLRPTATNLYMSGPYAPYSWLTNGYSGYHHSWWVYGVAPGDTLQYRIRRWHADYQTTDIYCNSHWYYGYPYPYPDAATISHSFLTPFDSTSKKWAGDYYLRIWSNRLYWRNDTTVAGWETIPDTTLGSFADSLKSGLLTAKEWVRFNDKIGKSDSALYYTSLARFRDSLAQVVKKRDSLSVYASYPAFRDSLAKVVKQRDSTIYATWPRLRDSLAQVVKKRDSLSVYASYPAFRDSLAKKSPISSPTFTGTPAAPTAGVGTNTTQLATTAFVIANAGAGANPAKQTILDSLNAASPDTIALNRLLKITGTTPQMILKYNDANFMKFSVGSTGLLGINGLTNPATRVGIGVVGQSTATLYLQSTAQYGLYNLNTVSTAGVDVYGISGYAKASGSANGSVYGFSGTGYWNSDSNSTGYLIGLRGLTYMDKAVTVPAAMSVYATNPFVVAGTITNAFGLFIESITAGTGNYSIYSLGGTGYHAGSFGFGTIPSAKIHALSTTEQLRLGYDASNYTSFTVGATGGLAIGGAGTNGGSITGNTLLRDTSAFTTTGTRVAIYIAGATSTDQYQVTARHSGDSLPAEHGDDLAYWAKTDSVIVTRPAGGTSGLKFGWLRIR
jgi:hypothetical protein